MPSLYVVAGVTNLSAKIDRIDVWRKATEGIGRFVINIQNQDGEFLGAFAADDPVQIRVDNADVLKGYLDVGRPISKDDQDIYQQLMELTGRDYGQDAENKITNKLYKTQHADDIIADMIVQSGTEITFTSPSTAPSIPYLGPRDEFLIAAWRKIWQRIDYDGYVDETKKLKMFPIGTVESGITLKCVAGAQDNNILDLRKIEFDALELRNYIIVRGGLVIDGWTDGNAVDFETADAGNVISDYYGSYVKSGTGAIKSRKGTASYCSLRFSFPKYNYPYLDFTKIGIQQMDFHLMQYITSPGMDYIGAPMVRLTDSDGRQISYWFSHSPRVNAMAHFTVPVGPLQFLGSGDERDVWVQSSGTGFNWQVARVEFHSLVESVEYILLDSWKVPGIKMLAIAQDGASQGSYKSRYLPLERTDIQTQLELQAYADSMKTKRKYPLEGLSILAKGEAGIIEGANKWIPAYNVTVNSPGDLLDNVKYRIYEVHHIITPNAYAGCDHIVEVTLVPFDAPLDVQRLGYAQTPELSLMKALDDRVSYLEKIAEQEKFFWPGLPQALTSKRIWEHRGTAFPADPYDMQRFYRPDLDTWFRYSENAGSWIPTDRTIISRSDIPLTLQGVNLIPNFSFEKDFDDDGQPDLWTITTSGATTVSLSTAHTHHGGFSLKVNAKVSATYSFYAMSDYIPISSNMYLAFFIWGKAENNTHAFMVYIYWYKKDKSAASTPSSALTFLNNKNWSPNWLKYEAAPIQAPSDAVFCRVVPYLSGIGADDVYYYDKASLIQTIREIAIEEETGASFPSDPYDGERFYNETIDCHFRYVEGRGWIPSMGRGYGVHSPEIKEIDITEDTNSKCFPKAGGSGWGEWEDISKLFSYEADEDILHVLTKLKLDIELSVDGEPASQEIQVKALTRVNGGDWTQFGSTYSRTSEGKTTGHEFTDSLETDLDESLEIKLQSREYNGGSVTEMTCVNCTVSNFETTEKKFNSVGVEI